MCRPVGGQARPLLREGGSAAGSTAVRRAPAAARERGGVLRRCSSTGCNGVRAQSSVLCVRS